jgi:hypothetical protein
VRLEVGDSWAEGGGSRLLLVWRILSSATDLCMVLPSGYDVTTGTCAVYVNDGRGFYMSICGRGEEMHTRDCNKMRCLHGSRRTPKIAQGGRCARRDFARFGTYLAAVSVLPARVSMDQS